MLRPNNHGSLDLIDDETGEILDEVFFKTPYNHNTNAETDRVALTCKDKSLTDQSFAVEVDINTIINKALRTKEMPNQIPGDFGDATAIPTLFEMRTKIAENNATFYKLPAHIRAQHQNDPSQWELQVLTAVQNQDTKELKKLGLSLDELDNPDLGAPGAPKPPGGDQGGPPAPGTPEGTVAPATVQNGPKGP